MKKTEKVKGYIYTIIGIVSLAAIIIDTATDVTTIEKIINREDYFFYDPKIIPILLEFPSMIFAELCLFCVLLPFRKKTFAFMNKLMIPVIVYAWAALIIGILLSIVISFYPLGTDYYKCDSTSVVSSGSHYAKTKEVCKEKAWKPSDD